MSRVAPTVEPLAVAGSSPIGTAPASSSLFGRSGAETASLNLPASELTRCPTRSRNASGVLCRGCVSNTKRACPFAFDASQRSSFSWPFTTW